MKTKIFQCFIIILLPIVIYSQKYSAGDNELLLMPTAYTMPVGNSYFSDYELFLLNYSYAVSSSTHLSIFSLFPITTSFYESLTFGIKQKIITYGSIQSALYGSYTPKSTSYSIGDVVSIGQPSKSFHVSLAYVKYRAESDADWIYMLGFRIDPSEKTSLLIEYENANSLIRDDFKGLLSFGIKIHSRNMSWEIAGIRPIGSSGSLLLIPLLKVGYYFN
jgi:hypothetical protein